MSGTASSGADVARAEIVPVRSWRTWTWLIPLAAVGLGIWLGYRAMQEAGPRIVIAFEDGAGLTVGDPVKHRGVQVGTVRSIGLSPGLDGVDVTVELVPSAEGLAVEGTTFWVVVPEVGLTEVSGLDTLLGPRYIAAMPATAGASGLARADRFEGLTRPPVGRGSDHGGLALVLRGTRATSLTPGAPVYYRDIQVGSVTTLALSEDARHVEIGVAIASEFAHLVRSNSRFWNVSGIGLDLGFRGVKLRAESLAAVVSGGVAFATPTRAGATVDGGHLFVLEEEGDEDWLDWSPVLRAPEGVVEGEPVAGSP